MKKIFVSCIVTGVLLLGAPTASAIALILDMGDYVWNDDGPGATLTVRLLLDTEGETGVTTVFASIANMNYLTTAFESGTSPGSILVNSNFDGLIRAYPPQGNVLGEPRGNVHAAGFSTSLPYGTGVASSNQLLSTIVYAFTGPSPPAMLRPVLTPGIDLVTVNQIDVTSSVRLVVIPEPGVALLLALGLGGLAAAARRAH